MKRLITNLVIMIFLCTCSYSNNRVENLENKVERNGLVYIKGESTPFTGILKSGEVEQEYRNGIRNGVFKGKILVDGSEYNYEGTFVEGIKHGKWIIKYLEGKNRAILEYNYDMPEGQWVYFYNNGKKEFSETFKDGILEGTVVEYDPQGNVKKKLKYQNGLLEGEVVFFYDGNVLDILAHFNHGRLNGRVEIFSQENILQLEGNYKNDKRESLWKLYYKTGDLKVTVPYKKGLKHGKSVIYDKSGGIVQVNSYENNNEIDENGNILKRAEPFRDGIVERFKKFNNNLKSLKYNKALSEI